MATPQVPSFHIPPLYLHDAMDRISNRREGNDIGNVAKAQTYIANINDGVVTSVRPEYSESAVRLRFSECRDISKYWPANESQDSHLLVSAHRQASLTAIGVVQNLAGAVFLPQAVSYDERRRPVVNGDPKDVPMIAGLQILIAPKSTVWGNQGALDVHPDAATDESDIVGWIFREVFQFPLSRELIKFRHGAIIAEDPRQLYGSVRLINPCNHPAVIDALKDFLVIGIFNYADTNLPLPTDKKKSDLAGIIKTLRTTAALCGNNPRKLYDAALLSILNHLRDASHRDWQHDSVGQTRVNIIENVLMGALPESFTDAYAQDDVDGILR